MNRARRENSKPSSTFLILLVVVYIHTASS